MKKYILPLVIGLFSLQSCTQGFEEMNTDTDNITQQVASAELLLPNVLIKMADTHVNADFTLGSVVSQHTTYLLYNNIDKYIWQADDRYWQYYNQLENLNDITKLAERDQELQYKGVAMVLKAFLFSQISDAYGSIPFSQAGKASEGIYKPKYDTQEAVYNGINQMLIEANSILKNGGTIKNDRLYNGDANKWRKFANSLRLRILLKLNNKVDKKAEFASLLDNPTEYPIFTSNADQAVYNYPGTGNLVSPYSVGRGRAYEIQQLIALTSGFKNILDEFQDPRIAAWYDKPAAQPNGNYIASPAGTTNGDYANVSMLSLSFYAQPNKIKARYLSYAELEFILAEAAAKSWITSNAKTHYDKAVTASFEDWGVALPANYLTLTALYTPNNFSLIAKQKHIALFGNGFEAWNEIKRNGLVVLSPSINNQNSNLVPKRLLYPSLEQSVNMENYNQGVQSLGGQGDNINTKVWWQQ